MASFKENLEGKSKELKADMAETKAKIGTSIDSGVRTTKRWIRNLFLGLLVLGIVGLGVYYFIATSTFSSGTRAGQLIKVSEKGVMLKTYEGQLSMGGLSMDGNQPNIGNIWEFSVKEDAIYKQLQDLQGKEVVLTYRQQYQTFPWQGDTVYFIEDVKVGE